jgi:hypothetical protein
MRRKVFFAATLAARPPFATSAFEAFRRRQRREARASKERKRHSPLRHDVVSR